MAANENKAVEDKANENKTVNATVLAKAHTESAIETLAEICAFGESEGSRVTAANSLLDRGHGRAAQTLDITSGGKAIVPVGMQAFYAKIMQPAQPQLERAQVINPLEGVEVSEISHEPELIEGEAVETDPLLS